jgi:hypothetical protein
MSVACMFLKIRKKYGATPRDSMGLASVREKRRSRHASQALLLFWRMAMGTIHLSAGVYSTSVMRLPSSFCYSPVALYDYRKFPAPRQEALPAPSLPLASQGFTGPKEQNLWAGARKSF